MIAQSLMDTHLPTPLLGGISPQVFMRRYWQKKPLLIRQAAPGALPMLDRKRLFELAARDDVESRAIIQDESRWRLKTGPFAPRSLPPISRPGWTMLVQGLDLHLDEARALLSCFRFVPDARLDDLMVSWASDGGGVGPHTDSYDVFLLQVRGRRRWRIGPLKDATLQPDVPLRILQNFEPDQEWLLEPGDMLYLPPLWAHDGVADGECMTASIGFRAPPRSELGRELLQRMLDDAEAPENDPLYRDASQPATEAPARVPAAMQQFALDAAARWLKDSRALVSALGEVLTEPKPRVWFEPGAVFEHGAAVQLDRRTRMMYDDHHVFINGESYQAGGRDARLMRSLADDRHLSAREVSKLSPQAMDLLAEWVDAGWVRSVP